MKIGGDRAFRYGPESVNFKVMFFAGILPVRYN
jgi:hypothetical protein